MGVSQSSVLPLPVIVMSPLNGGSEAALHPADGLGLRGSSNTMGDEADSRQP